MPSARAVLLLLGFYFCTQATADTGASEWLARLGKSADDVAYRGVLIHEVGDHTESLRITHGTVDGRLYDHLEHLDGDPREVIRSGSSLTCIHPDQRLTRLLRSQQDGVAGGQVESVEAHYTLQLSGESRVAGRPVVLLEVAPRDSFRLGYRFAFDRETGLLLRSEQVDASQRVLERFQFAELEVSDKMLPAWLPDQSTAATPTATAAAVVPAAASVALPAKWLPKWLPPGFSPVVGTDGGDVQTYSDGLAMVSIFVAEADSGAVESAGGDARRGATVAHTALLHRDDKAYVVTVIGEVPTITAQRVADAVVWQEGGS